MPGAETEMYRRLQCLLGGGAPGEERKLGDTE